MSRPMGEVPMTTFDHFLHRREGDPRLRSSFLGIELLDSVPDWPRFLASFERASRSVPRLRQRVVIPTAPTTSPRWVIDADFDLGYHVRRVALPGGGAHRDLLDFAEQVFMTPLELSRPLWRVTLIEGLDDGGAALLTHMSHSIVDGVGAIDMFAHLYDLTPEGRTSPMPDLPVPVDLEPGDLTLEGVKELPGRTVAFARSALGRGVRALTNPVGTVTASAGYAASLRRVLGAVTEAAPSPLLAGRGLQRRMLTVDVDLRALKAAAKVLGGSVNDAYVAAMCGALRRYHDALGLPVDTLPMAIPVSLPAGAGDTSGNHWTGLILAAPIGEANPAARIATVHDVIAAKRGEPALDLLGVFSTLTSTLPDVLVDPLMGLVQPADVQCSNIKSYPGPTYIGGSQIMAQYGMGPVPGVALMSVMITRLGRAFVGVRYDTASFADGDLLERCLTEGFDEVVLAGGQTRPLPGTTPKAAPEAVRLAPGVRTPRKRTTSPAASKTTATDKAATKKAAAKSSAVKRATAKPPTAKSSTAKSPTAKSSTAKSSTAKTSTTKKAPAKSPTAKTPGAAPRKTAR